MDKQAHNDLVLMALTWLSNKVTGKGMRAETEVCLGEGYVADVVAMCSLQWRFFQLYSHNNKIPTINDYFQHRSDCNHKDNAVVNYLACIFEAKASRNDFLGTFNQSKKHINRHAPIGNLHWCVVNKGIAKPEELPGFWGLLEPFGSGLSEKKKPVMQTRAMGDLDKIAHALLWPIQASRKYFICKTCKRYANEGYCMRCKGSRGNFDG